MHPRAPRVPALLAGVTLLLLAGDVTATYSIAAVDKLEGLVGGAGTSCVGTLSVSVIQGLVPGVGVVHAQAALNTAARDQAVVLLGQGATAQEVISAITASSFDLQAAQRQYGVVRLDGDIAA